MLSLLKNVLEEALADFIELETEKIENSLKEKLDESIKYLTTNIRFAIIEGFKEGANILTSKLSILVGGVLFLIGLANIIDIYMGISGVGYALVGMLLVIIGYAMSAKY